MTAVARRSAACLPGASGGVGETRRPDQAPTASINAGPLFRGEFTARLSGHARSVRSGAGCGSSTGSASISPRHADRGSFLDADGHARRRRAATLHAKRSRLPGRQRLPPCPHIRSPRPIHRGNANAGAMPNTPARRHGSHGRRGCYRVRELTIRMRAPSWRARPRHPRRSLFSDSQAWMAGPTFAGARSAPAMTGTQRPAVGTPRVSVAGAESPD